MRKVFRQILQPFLWRWYRWYNRRSHWVQVDGLELHIGPGVFHPRWFLTTQTLTNFALQQIEQNSKVLELGAGNGFLALRCCQAGASVTATDINVAAIESIKKSSMRNALPLVVIHADLFDQIAQKDFDFIFVNPPYFPKTPTNEQELAFFCGENFEYFQRFFAGLANFKRSKVYLILTDDCDLKRITVIAQAAGKTLQIAQQSHHLGEQHFIFEITSDSLYPALQDEE